ncbi:BamA/TamA family outer membrane protein [Zunongwangia sp.]|uniref:translocation and assembly module lipoprotein TamL n=1 Tax=Zunongwangia sp. TaxID=1965325 RepID=UPI003AA7DFDD
MKHNKGHLYIIGIIVLLQACNVKKFIPKNELLYRGAEIEVIPDTSSIKNVDATQQNLENVLVPKPNTKFLGSYPGLYFYYKAQREKPGIINKFLNKKIGEEPVYLSDVNISKTQDLLINRLENDGYFYSRANADVSFDTVSKTAKASYTVSLPQPYKMKTYQLVSDSLPVYRSIKPILKDAKFKEDMLFNLSDMKSERERLDLALKEKGYYNFNPTFLLFQADTNRYDKKQFDLFLKIKKSVPEKAIIPYKISEVSVYPNNNINNDSVSKDTVQFANKKYIQTTDPLFFKPERLDPFILIEEGDYYSPKKSRATSRRLGNIGAYKFVNIDYEEVDSSATDSLGLLRANIYLSPLTKKSIRAELQAVSKSNNFAGPSLALALNQRNLFSAGVSLKTSLKLGYEFQAASGDQSGLNSIQIGLGNDLVFPRLLFPWKPNKNYFKYDIPKTKISMNIDYLKRSDLFELASLSSSFGYIWNANRYITYTYDPVALNYVDLIKKTDKFQKILDKNDYLKSSFEQQFIAGSLFSFTYNGMVDTEKKQNFYLNTNLDFAGNLLSLISGHSKEDPQTVFNLEYAQYAKLDVDIRYHYKFKQSGLLAARLFGGYGMPYGNSDIIPFTKQYFSGGPYSVRAFKIRSLGPGTYNPDNDPDKQEPTEDVNINSDYFDRAGNVRLEANIEYRFPLFSYLNGAVFADAGNVWTTNSESSLKGGEFSSNFINELGIGSGIGLRVDIQGFVLRFDLAAPIHDPQKPSGGRWKFDVSKPVFNFAIGYPF